MARFDTAFDAAGIEPTTAYEILPAGKYRAQIVESEMRVTKNGMGKYLWLMLDILEGPQQGRKVFDQLNLVEPPRVYRRAFGSMIRLLFRQRSSLRRRPPLLRSA